MRRYEVVYISFDDLSADEFEGQLERYTSIVSKMDGKVVKIDKWGKRRLAYPIQKRRDGVYVLIDFVGEGEIVSELERNFRIDDKILRFISVKTSDKVDLEEIEREIAKARESEQAKEEAAAAEQAAKEAAVAAEQEAKEAAAAAEQEAKEAAAAAEQAAKEAAAAAEEAAKEAAPEEAVSSTEEAAREQAEEPVAEETEAKEK